MRREGVLGEEGVGAAGYGDWIVAQLTIAIASVAGASKGRQSAEARAKTNPTGGPLFMWRSSTYRAEWIQDVGRGVRLGVRLMRGARPSRRIERHPSGQGRRNFSTAIIPGSPCDKYAVFALATQNCDHAPPIVGAPFRTRRRPGPAPSCRQVPPLRCKWRARPRSRRTPYGLRIATTWARLSC